MSDPKHRHKTIDELKTWLMKTLRLQDDPNFFEALWMELHDMRVISEWEQELLSDQETLEQFKQLLSRFRRLNNSLHNNLQERRAQSSTESISTYLSKEEEKVSETLADYLAARAARHKAVQRFRNKLPGGGVLTEERSVREFLTTQPRGEQALGYVDFPGGVRIETDLWWAARDMVRPQYAQPRREVTKLITDLQHSARTGRDLSLEELAGWLVHMYPWEAGEAVLFAVMGRRPRVNALDFWADNLRGTVSVTALEWVSEETVRRAFRPPWRGRRLPRGKTLAVLRFVAQQTDAEGKKPPWSELFKRWNDAHPDDKFFDRSGLRRAYKRAEQTIAYRWSTRQI